MAPSKTAKKGGGGGGVGSAPSPLTNVPWPSLKPKTLASPEWLIPDQVCLFPNFLSTEECKSIIHLFSSSSSSTSGDSSVSNNKKVITAKKNNGPTSLVLSPSPPAKRGEAVRTNYRASTIDPTFASQLYSLGLDQAVADWPSLEKHKPGTTPKIPAGLHSNIRIYRYDPQAFFGPHYDQSSQCPTTFLHSEWTLLIYLSGPESGLTGGQTIFYDKHSAASGGKSWEVEPRTGLALLHRHGPACMLHAGLPPLTGEKWVLRSDLLFR
ncbi:hypothetical protein CF327_g2951 [Tilletia walkeri]|uniref:Fe2OG dioxygenase domain-containing protein n=1 Tax=Tilletia walkeri TaxID=117179 RepID=A0A8X7NBR6_9BASI|nr:hypothetical protein CF327_g2951 [Tilletia walkeri]KAE8270991.1 hypothetical protein A4X09_0g1358 [Tilletia walkeri]